MNSGMRLTAAVIALVVIATGIYYASLGSDENRPSPVTLAEADTEGSPASKGATEPTPAAAPVEVREPTTKAPETPASTRPPAPAEPTPAMETTAPGDSKVEDDSTSESLVADSSNAPEAAVGPFADNLFSGSEFWKFEFRPRGFVWNRGELRRMELDRFRDNFLGTPRNPSKTAFGHLFHIFCSETTKVLCIEIP